ncbi:MAG TPA: diguanylate cyclase [Solirubrobacteraceae bacterium]|nr:diguanylate cyclase [Solirubrobacteraceae bacterium]
MAARSFRLFGAASPVDNTSVKTFSAISRPPVLRRGHPRRGHQLGVSARFATVIVVLALCLAAVGATGISAVHSTHGSLERIYSDNVVTTRHIADLGTRIDAAEETILYALLTIDPAGRHRLAARVTSSLIPNIAQRVATVSKLVSDSAVQRIASKQLSAAFVAFTRAWSVSAPADGTFAARSARAKKLASLLDRMSGYQAALFGTEGAEARTRATNAARDYSENVQLLVAIVIGGLLVTILVVLWLIRSVLPRLLAYSRFAERMVAGDYSGRLEPRGRDEIARLGQTLEEVARRRRSEDDYDRAQTEFSNALQVAGDEAEARALLQRYLERSIPNAHVVVLNRNEGQEWLTAVTPLADDSTLHAALEAAAPRACLSIRNGAQHSEDPGSEHLVTCEICSREPGLSTCTPLLVGGEVMGAVLVAHLSQLDDDSRRRIRESVRQAAPVMANLRNLARSQSRAATDALTGLANRRALEDTIKRMVAQAHRAELPLAALMLDLDHFKQINDDFGHAKGDEILAAFGAQLEDVLRAGDFAARYGGEEFMVLLPGTGAEGALVLAERLRVAVHAIRVNGLDRKITASVGVAVLGEHALDAEGLERAADRALYVAKAGGRDRVQLVADETPAVAGA